MTDYVDDDFEWNREKSDATFEDRGIDFFRAVRIFEAPYLEQYDDAHSLEESRFTCIGHVDGLFIFVVYADRGARKRIISARLCVSGEVDEYAQQFGL